MFLFSCDEIINFILLNLAIVLDSVFTAFIVMNCTASLESSLPNKTSPYRNYYIHELCRLANENFEALQNSSITHINDYEKQEMAFQNITGFNSSMSIEEWERHKMAFNYCDSSR